MVSKSLRPYQEEAISRIMGGIKQGNTSGIVHFFTGGGKSITAIEANRRILPPTQGRSIMIAPARSLIFQMANNYKTQWGELRAGVSINNTVVPGIGVVMDRYNQSNARIIVGSSQTLVDRNIEDLQPIEKSDLVVDKYGNITKSGNSARRVLVSERFDDILANGGLPKLIQLDECHHSPADGSLAMLLRLQQIQKALDIDPINVVGYTATPTRNDGKGLFNLFKTIYISRSYKWAQENGYLVPFADPIRVVIDDGNRAVKLQNVSNWIDLVVDVARDRAADRHIMGFTGRMGNMGGVEASIAIAAGFVAAGIKAAHIDGSKCIDEYGIQRPISARGEIYERFMRGEIKALWSFGVGLEGLDLPIADCLFWLRPTDNSLLITQAVGRILRLHPDKKDAQIYEFTGKDIALTPVGTLFGYKVDPFTEKYVVDDIEEEDELLEGINLKDFTKKGEIWGENKVYNVADIISKSTSDWHRDENTDFMSLSVAPNTTLVISPPNYTKTDSVARAREDVENLIGYGNNTANPYANDEFGEKDFKRFAYLKTLPQNKLLEIDELLQWAYAVYSSFSMWRIENTKVHGNSWVMRNSSLDILLLDSVEYSYMNIENQTDMFTDKKKSWKSRDLATAKQRKMLEELKYGDYLNPKLKKGEASRWISHLIVVPVLQRYFTVVETYLKGCFVL